MEAYTGFAAVYDLFQDNVPYDEWCTYLAGLLAGQGVTEGIVLDLGCGTGNMTVRLADLGYDMIGVDSSPEMLEIAQGKQNGQHSILYLCQDMRAFELYGTVAAVISICDSVNYIIDPEELTEVFRLVNNYLDPGGVFIFDLNTVYKYETLLADQTFAEVRDESSFIWENDYDKQERIHELCLTLFIREAKNGLYRRYTETHYQRAYCLSEVRQAAETAGLAFVAAYDAFTREPVRPDSERIYVILRERGKTDGRLHC